MKLARFFDKEFDEEIESLPAWNLPCSIKIMKVLESDQLLKYETLCRTDVFRAFFQLLTEYNKNYNLTSIIEEREVYYKHFLDSAAGSFLFPVGARVCEIGSGAGFPSLVLKLIRPDLSFTLVESVGKKCNFLREVISRFSLSDMEVKNVRAEDLAREGNYREKFDVCTARAVARLNTLSEYCLPFVKLGGTFVAYKGESEEERKESESAFKELGGALREVYAYELPCAMGRRTLIEVEKIAATPVRYPRGNGKERKHPL